VIGRGELKIYPTKMEAIIKWLVHTNLIEVRIFDGETWYLCNFVTFLLVVVVALHAITMSDKSFQW
jgi:hypothetical protein